jgi:S1-C subfamily serine protease
MRYWTLTLLLLLSACTVAIPGGRVGAAKQVWKLIRIGGGATGFPIYQTYNADDRIYTVWFLTAGHATIGDKDAIWAATLRNERALFRGVHTMRHPKLDAALITFRTRKPVKLLSVSDRTPAFGEEVWAVGYPLMLGPFITPGIVSGPGMFSSSIYRASTDVYSGSSGGPVIDSLGRVVGISVGAGTDKRASDNWIIVTHMAFFVPTSKIVGWLKDNGLQ